MCCDVRRNDRIADQDYQKVCTYEVHEPSLTSFPGHLESRPTYKEPQGYVNHVIETYFDQNRANYTKIHMGIGRNYN